MACRNGVPVVYQFLLPYGRHLLAWPNALLVNEESDGEDYQDSEDEEEDDAEKLVTALEEYAGGDDWSENTHDGETYRSLVNQARESEHGQALLGLQHRDLTGSNTRKP